MTNWIDKLRTLVGFPSVADPRDAWKKDKEYLKETKEILQRHLRAPNPKEGGVVVIVEPMGHIVMWQYKYKASPLQLDEVVDSFEWCKLDTTRRYNNVKSLSPAEIQNEVISFGLESISDLPQRSIFMTDNAGYIKLKRHA